MYTGLPGTLTAMLNLAVSRYMLGRREEGMELMNEVLRCEELKGYEEIWFDYAKSGAIIRPRSHHQ